MLRAPAAGSSNPFSFFTDVGESLDVRQSVGYLDQFFCFNQETRITIPATISVGGYANGVDFYVKDANNDLVAMDFNAEPFVIHVTSDGEDWTDRVTDLPTGESAYLHVPLPSGDSCAISIIGNTLFSSSDYEAFVEVGVSDLPDQTFFVFRPIGIFGGATWLYGYDTMKLYTTVDGETVTELENDLPVGYFLMVKVVVAGGYFYCVLEGETSTDLFRTLDGESFEFVCELPEQRSESSLYYGGGYLYWGFGYTEGFVLKTDVYRMAI